MGVAEVAQGRLARRRPAGGRAAAAAVAAVGAAARDVGLAAERRGPVAAVAGMDPDLHAVKEHRGLSSHASGGPASAGHRRDAHRRARGSTRGSRAG